MLAHPWRMEGEGQGGNGAVREQIHTAPPHAPESHLRSTSGAPGEAGTWLLDGAGHFRSLVSASGGEGSVEPVDRPTARVYGRLDRHKLAIEIRVLGRVDALVDGRSLPLREGKQRGVLAMLALRANRTVSADELIDGLWADRPPTSAAKNLQSFVSQLRKALASDDAEASILTRGRGYELRVAEEAVDALRFEQLVEEAAREPPGAGANGLAGGACRWALPCPWGKQAAQRRRAARA